MTAANILMKINHKLGGINTSLAEESQIALFKGRGPVMVLSASLSHSMGDGPTVAAVSASIDPAAAKYIGFVTLQSKTHFIEGIKDLTLKALTGFYEATKSKPAAIIYYRDGLGEGQYNDALKYEVTEIRNACTEKEDGYAPGITMLSVQRRHHTKLFCENDRDGVGKNVNVPAGTVVDHGITSGQIYDFYLCAHAGIMGTSRPAHYMLLHDDNNLSGHTLQVMSFFLCHTYARCTRTVAMPVGIYYAQLLAARGRYWLRQCGFSEDDTLSTMSGDSGDGKKAEKLSGAQKTIENLHGNLKSSMFFC